MFLSFMPTSALLPRMKAYHKNGMGPTFNCDVGLLPGSKLFVSDLACVNRGLCTAPSDDMYRDSSKNNVHQAQACLMFYISRNKPLMDSRRTSTTGHNQHFLRSFGTGSRWIHHRTTFTHSYISVPNAKHAGALPSFVAAAGTMVRRPLAWRTQPTHL